MIFCKSEIDGCRTWTHSGQVSLRCVMPLRWKLGEEQVVSGTLSPWPVVQNGSNGHPIRTLQFLLRARGHNLIIDGIFGSVTEAAVKAFQSSKGASRTAKRPDQNASRFGSRQSPTCKK